MATLPLRQIEGKYEILEKIKEGGMGTIYKVRHRLLDEVRVVKVMRPQIADSEDLQRRFAREARAAIRLKHPNIAQLYDFAVEPEGVAYMVMEFIEGVTLQEMLARSGPAPLHLTLEIAQQGLEALRYLHALGYIHRDVAPDNLMLTKDFAGQPQIKLIDLGIVKHLAGGGEGLTATGMFLGKVRYSSPEQFSGEKGGVDQRSDLYSFGVMLYELLTGKCPIVGENLSQLVAAHLFQPPLGFEETDPEGRVPEDIRAAVMKSLAKAPEERFASAQELQEALARHQSAQDLAQDLEATLATTNMRSIVDQVQPGTTQDHLDANFGMVRTPGPGAGLRAADGATATEPKEQQVKLLDRARKLAQDRQWEEARLLLYQALAINPDHEEIRTLLGAVEAALKQAIEEEKRRQAIATAAARVDAHIRQERPDDAMRELAEARATYGDQVEWPVLEKRLESLRAALVERARQAEIAEVAAHIGGLLDAEQTEPAQAALAAARKRYGEEASLVALRARLGEVERRLDDRRQEQEAAARRERARTLLADAARLAAGGAFAEAIVRAEQALALDRGDAEAQRVLDSYRADEAKRLEQIRRQRALDDAASKIAALLERDQAEAASRELEAALEALGSDPRLEELGRALTALRQTLAAREREQVRQQAIADALSSIDSQLARESADAAQKVLAEASNRLGDDPRFGVAVQRIAKLRADLLERERQRELEEKRRLEQERRRQEEERLAREEEQRRQEAEARRREEERRKRAEEEARRKREEEEARRKSEEEEARRQEEERRRRAEAEARRRQAATILASAAEQARRGELQAALETAQSAIELDPAPARLAADQYQRSLAAEKRAKRLEQLLAAAQSELAAGELDSALNRLESEQAAFGGDAAWQQLVSRTQTAIERREAERKRQEAIAAEAAAIERLVEKGRTEKAEKRLEKARAEMGEAAQWGELERRLESLRAEAARALEAQAAEAALRREEAARERDEAARQREEAARQREAQRTAEQQRKAQRAAEKQRESERAAEAREAQRAADALAAEQQREAERVAEARQTQRVPASTLRTPDAPRAGGVKPVVWAAAAGVVLLIAIAAWFVRSGPESAPSMETPSEIAADSTAQLEPAPGVPSRPLSDDEPSRSESMQPGAVESDRGAGERGIEPSLEAPAVGADRDPSSRPAPKALDPAPPPVPATQPRAEASRPETADTRIADRPGRDAAGAAAPVREPSGASAAATRPTVERLPETRIEPTAAPARPAVAPPPPPARRAEPAPTPAAPPPPRAIEQPAAAAPAPARAVDEKQGVLDTLARYRAAYQSLDADAVARVFTGADVRDLRRAFKQSKSMSVQFDVAGCDTAVTGDTATAACNVTRVTEPKAGERMTRNQRETFYLRRTSSGWVVERVQ